MSCHYTCSSCFANVYYDLCNSCPSTRTLTYNTCVCSSGYYQIQQQTCQLSSQASTLDSLLINISSIAFYFAIGLHLFTIILTLNRLVSPSLKKIIDTFQVIGLISNYRYVHTSIATQALHVINSFNFNYLNSIVCDEQSPPYGCSTFQNLIGPAFTILLFLILFLVSYLLAFCMYAANSDDNGVVYIRNGKQQKGKGGSALEFGMYCRSIWPSFLVLYLDQTAIQTAVAISQIAIVNYYGVLVLFPFLLIIGLAGKMHFSTINHPLQTTLAYRAKHSYFFLYDQCYHFNYIDHIFNEQNLNTKKTLKKVFYPQSNLIIIQILFKILLGTSTIVFYQYQPYLFAYICICLLLIYFFMMKSFCFYQQSTLAFYLLSIALHGFSVGTFFISKFFTYFISILSVANLIILIVSILMIISRWKSSREGEMIKKIYELQNNSHKIGNIDDSEEELISKNKQEFEVDKNFSTIRPELTAQKEQFSKQQNTVIHPSRISRRNFDRTNNKLIQESGKDSRLVTMNRMTNRLNQTKNNGEQRRFSKDTILKQSNNLEKISEGNEQNKVDLLPSQDNIQIKPSSRLNRLSKANIFQANSQM